MNQIRSTIHFRVSSWANSICTTTVPKIAPRTILIKCNWDSRVNRWSSVQIDILLLHIKISLLTPFLALGKHQPELLHGFSFSTNSWDDIKVLKIFIVSTLHVKMLWSGIKYCFGCSQCLEALSVQKKWIGNSIGERIFFPVDWTEKAIVLVMGDGLYPAFVH